MSAKRTECFLICGTGVQGIHSILSAPQDEKGVSALGAFGCSTQLLALGMSPSDASPENPLAVFLDIPVEHVATYIESYEGLVDGANNFRVNVALVLDAALPPEEHAQWEAAVGSRFDLPQWRDTAKYDAQEFKAAADDLVAHVYDYISNVIQGPVATAAAPVPAPEPPPALVVPKPKVVAVKAAAPTATPEVKPAGVYKDIVGKIDGAPAVKPKVTINASPLKVVTSPTATPPQDPAAPTTAAPTTAAPTTAAAPVKRRKPAEPKVEYTAEVAVTASVDSGMIIIEIPNIRISIPASQIKRS